VNGPGAGDAAQFAARRADIEALEGISGRFGSVSALAGGV